MGKISKYFLLLMFLVASVVGCSGDDYGAFFLISEDSHNFGVVAVGDNSMLELTLTNAGQSALKVDNLEITDLATGTVVDEFKIMEVLDFEDTLIEEPYEGIKVKSKNHITIKIKFEPTDDVAKSAFLSITHNVKDIAMPYMVELLGNTAQLAISATSHDYGIVDEGNNVDETFTVTNNGTTDLMVYGIDFAGDPDFALEASDSSFMLAPAATKDIVVRFSPLAAGGRTATMTLRSNAIQSPTDVVLTGTGKPALNYEPTVQNPTVDPAFVKADGTVTVTFTLEVDDQNGMADIKAVEADCSAIGGGLEMLYDDGTNGDVAADDKTYTGEFLVPNTATAGIFQIVIEATDYSDAKASDVCVLSLYKGNLIYVDDTTGDDTTGTGAELQPFKTIQKGIDVAVDTDTVIIKDGEYTGPGNVNLDFSSGTTTTKKIVVKSENGKDNVIIDCEGAARGFIFNTGETTESIILGLTIKNGTDAQMGAGLFIEDSSPAIVECLITECTITRTSSGDVSGAGVYITGTSKPEFYYTEISNNSISSTYNGSSSYANGGGVYVGSGTQPYFEGCKINNNSAMREYYYVRGGGMYFGANTDTRKLVGCEIKGNMGVTTYNYSVYGGAIYAYSNCHIEFVGCEISDNTNNSYSTAYSGAIYADSSSGANITEIILDTCKLSGNLISSKTSSAYGAVFYGSAYVELDIDDSEITNNNVYTRSTARAGALYLNSYATVTIDNSKLSYNTVESMSSSAYAGAIYHANSCDFTFDNVEVSYNTVRAGSTGSAYGGAIYNSSSSSTYTFDDSEFNNNNIIGYSCYGGAFRTSSSSNKYAFTNCEINNNRAESYQSVSGGAFYISSTNPDISFSGTKINGNAAISMSSSAYGGGCYFQSYTDAEFDSNCEVNNNILKSGSSSAYGGGIYASSYCDIVFDDSEANGNHVTGYYVYGGGVQVEGYCTFKANGSKFNYNKAVTTNYDVYGAGVRIAYYSSGTIEFSEIKYNEAISSSNYVHGAGLSLYYIYNSPYFNIDQTEISYNHADGYYVEGGGVFSYRSQPYFRSSLISNNTAYARYYCYGGGIYNYASSTSYRMYLYNCTLSKNHAYQASSTTSSSAYGGGIYNSYGYVYFYNSILWRNKASYNNSGSASGNEFYASYTTYFYYCNVASGTTNGVSNYTGSYSLTSVLNSDPKFKDMVGDDFNLDTGSPCIDSGRNSDVSSSMTKDLAGNTRIVNSTVDRGCYEKQ